MSTKSQYKFTLSIPYPPTSCLNTLDLHLRTPPLPPTSPSFWIIYIHGGAFRDPLITSTSILPSLPALFSNPHIAAVASVNYRLSPYPGHATDPSSPDDGARNVVWPTHVEDVRAAIEFLGENYGLGGKKWVVVGHSVGATMAVVLGMKHPALSHPRPSRSSPSHPPKWGEPGLSTEIAEGLVGVVGLEGVYDFKMLRDNHLEYREVYEEFTTGAFGREEDGGWERGDLAGRGEEMREGVRVVVLGHSEEDEMVEYEQSKKMEEVLGKQAGKHGLVVLGMRVKGGHDEVVEQGMEVGRCVGRAIEVLTAAESS